MKVEGIKTEYHTHVEWNIQALLWSLVGQVYALLGAA